MLYVDIPTRSELAHRAQPILDKADEQDLAAICALFDKRASDRRTATDISDTARAATFGTIDTLPVDIDSVVPGFVDDESGKVQFVEKNDTEAYGVVDESAVRALASDTNVLGVRAPIFLVKRN